MKKTLLTILMVVLLACTCLFFVGCNNTQSNDRDKDILAIYNLYVANAEDNGQTPLSYEEWLESIKGEKGDKGEDGKTPTIEISEDGYWVINGEKTEYKAIGKDGVNGENGANGTNGIDGVGIESVRIDEKGHLMIKYTNSQIEVDLGKVIETETYSKGLEFELNEQETGYVLTGVGVCNDRKVIIPSEYNGKPVVAIGDSAFENDGFIKVVEIPNSVTSIGESAFYYCTSLTSVIIPDSVTSIGNCAFYICSLTSVNYLGTIDEWVQIEFAGDYSNPLCSAGNLYINGELVTEVELTTVTKISNYAFCNCDSLTSVVIGDSVTSIGNGAFSSCDSLTSVVIPDSVTSIGNGAFSSCDSLTSVVIPDSVTSIGNSAFFFCDSLTSVNYLGTIDEWAQIEFADRDSNPWCSAENLYINGELVTEVELTTATKISNYAFSGCDSLTSVVIPDSVTSIGDCAFCYCNSLTNIYCYAERQPNGWNGGWIANSNATVHWGYKGE